LNDSLITNSQSPDIFSAAFLLPNVGAPFIIGLAVGYFAKKMLRIALFFAGGAIVFLFISEYYGFVTVNEGALEHVASSAVSAAQSFGGFLTNRLSSIASKGMSAVTGFYFGLKMG
jgi:uncharacterized membrane protein (Fun14 family)